MFKLHINLQVLCLSITFPFYNFILNVMHCDVFDMKVETATINICYIDTYNMTILSIYVHVWYMCVQTI